MKKNCSKCKQELLINQFFKDKSRKDRLTCWCRKCYKKYIKLHKDKTKEYQKDYYLKNKIKVKEQMKQRQLIHKEDKKQYDRNYRINNKKRINKKLQKKLKNNIQFKLASILRIRIWQALRNNSKYQKTLDLLSCSIDFLKKYLESQFTKGMSWDNYGKWHIDHIKPCASFDLSKESEQRKCFNYKNLQPLWANENLSKGSKI
jgi:hypothetical protein